MDVPRRSLTPGAAFAVGTARICVSGYSASVRNVPQAEATAVYDRYGVAHVPYAHEVDHLVSLEIGGSNAVANLWPEPYAGRWGARTKDVLENRLHELVCSGRLALRKAQRIEARNWVAAYRRYVGGTPTANGGPSAPAGGSNAGGYYASSFGTASTIYCADDGAWRELSTRYLQHFRTWAAAHRRFPGVSPAPALLEGRAVRWVAWNRSRTREPAPFGSGSASASWPPPGCRSPRSRYG